MSPLSGLHAVVTGASSGIGREIALTLARRSALVTAVGRSEERLSRLAADAKPGCVRIRIADLANRDRVCALGQELAVGSPQVNVLVHCAGQIQVSYIAETSPEDLDAQFGVNVRAPFALTQKLMKPLCDTRGQVVFINSSAGLSSKPGAVAYSMTKHALKALADGLRAEVNSAGVRVISLYPGRTATPMQELILSHEGRTIHPACLIEPRDIASCVVQALELPRTAEITDLQVRPLGASA